MYIISFCNLLLLCHGKHISALVGQIGLGQQEGMPYQACLAVGLVPGIGFSSESVSYCMVLPNNEIIIV